MWKETRTPARFGSEGKLTTVCPISSDPFYVLAYYIIWVNTSRTDGMKVICIKNIPNFQGEVKLKIGQDWRAKKLNI